MKKLITGAKPTGESLHIGNLLGMILPFWELARWNDSAIFIADLHALTTVKDGDKMRSQSFEIAVEYLAIYGLDTPIRIFRQSDIPLIPKLNWILANVTPYSLMLRAHSFKDAENKWMDLNMGVFNYPILMAADILAYDTDIVPVGQDQKQHLEMTRDIARSFNKTYGADIFKLPEERIRREVAIVPGIDGRKMSKSYDNFIGVFDDEKLMKKRISSIVTDSKGVDELKDPDTCNVFALIKLFASPERTEEIRNKYLTSNAGYGYWHSKVELFEILFEALRPYRERREALLKNPEAIEARLAEWAKIMNERIEKKMEEIKEVVGL